MGKKTIIILWTLLFVSMVNYAQGEYRFVQFNTENGLSQSSVITIHQDQSGLMWFGTRDGLNKFDGTKFTTYKNSPGDSLHLSNSDILAIEEDRDGNLWIGTYNGLNVYDPKLEQFSNYFHSTENNSLSNNTVWTIAEIDDQIWVGTAKGLSIFDPVNKSFKNYLHSANSENSLPDNYIVKILEGKNGEVMIGTASGLCRAVISQNGEVYFEKIPFYIDGLDLEKVFVQDIIQDRGQNYWIATKTKGLFELNHQNKTLKSWNSLSEYSFLDKDIRSLNFDAENNLWIGSYQGVVVLNAAFQPIFNSYHNPDLAALTKIKSIFSDKKGSVWLGSYYGGVNLWDKANTNFINLQENQGQNGLSYHVVSSIVAQDELVYFGTEGGGITVYNTQSNKTDFSINEQLKGLNDHNIKSLYLSNNKLWIGTFTEGVSVLDLKNRKLDPNLLSVDLKNLLRSTGVYSINSENDDSYFLGTFGEGLIHYKPNSKQIKKFKSDPSSPNALTNNRVRKVFIDSKNRLWIGTQSGLNLISLDQIYAQDPGFTHFFYQDDINSGIDIQTIFEDSNRQIWVGTKALGLYKLVNESFEKEELPNTEKITTINAILEDMHQNLWLSTNQGIFKYNSVEKDIVIYDQKDGLASNEFKENAALNLDKKKLFFGTPTGVTYFDPEKLVVNSYVPQVILTDLIIKNESVKPNVKEGILIHSLAQTKKITLDYDNANFTIEFAIPNFVNPQNNLYTYRLKGLEEDWTTTSNNKVSYTIQNPGQYIFELKGANNDGIWNVEPTRLEIAVKPAPWRSWWAFSLYALLLGSALIGLILFLKSKATLKHKLDLEHTENVRNEEINQAKLQFFTNISHEFRTPLTLILGPLQQILLDYKGSNKMYKKLLVIENNANHLLQLINRLMDFRKMESNQLTLQAAEGNIVKFLKEIYFSFSEFAKNGNYTYTFESSDDPILIYYDRGKLERVFFNLISNAFRYTPEGGEIIIRLLSKEENLVIEVEDSGVGVAEPYLDKIFDRFFEIPIHNEPQKNYNKGTGIGLAIAKSMVELHKGSIEVKNKAAKGTIFRVNLPFGKDHLNENEILKDFKISDDLSQYESQLDLPIQMMEDELEVFEDNEKSATILLVEDNKPLRTFIKTLLNKDYHILEAENGKVALTQTLKHMPDLVVSDVIMPEMVGTELCAKIKENIKTSHIPVILLTSRTSLIYRFEGLESGADEYISKPFNIKEFRLKIKNLLAASSRLRQKFANEDNLSPSEITVSSLDEKLLRKAIQIVDENIENELFDIPFFCIELGVSRTMLFTKIKAWTNFTPNEFIHEMRLKRAAQLLEQDKINISQISYKVGFKNPKYFSKCFQRKYGMTPSQYQQKFHQSFIETPEEKVSKA